MSARLQSRCEDLYYGAMIRRDPDFSGIYVVGARTTGVFCRPDCPARLPNRKNCEFFADAKQAVTAGYRPCLRCRPQHTPHAVSDIVRRLAEAVEREPVRRWRGKDIEAFGVHASTARRQFRKRFGMTFVEYARAKRLGSALNIIRNGKPVIEAQLDVGYESGSGFREAFGRVIGRSPGSREARMLAATWFDAPLGPMIAAGDEQSVHCLEYADREGLDRQFARLRSRTMAGIVPGRSAAVAQLQSELAAYFGGKPMPFSTPLERGGSAFQNSVWDALISIPLGETRSYVEIARSIGRPDALRAVAQANRANPFAIVIPCHRVINSGGALGGYGGGLPRKLWLLAHEQKIIGSAVSFELR